MFEARRYLQFVVLSLVAMISLAFFSSGFSKGSFPSAGVGSVSRFYHPPPLALDATTVTVTVHAPTSTSSAPLLVKETATASYKENLRPELKYVTAWPAYGWNNQVMQYMNLLYLSLITERVPILPPFTPITSNHVATTTHIDFGDIFDLPRLQKGMKKSILEWRQVKDPESMMLDQLGCWNLERSVWKEIWPSRRPDNLKLDISYTLAPNWVKLVPDDYSDQLVTFWSLASLGFADTKPLNITPEASPIYETSILPDDQLLCFDNLYFVCAHEAWEFSNRHYSPAWRFVGRHMHWTSNIRNIAERYTRKALGIEPDEPIPPYISIHVRRGDFKDLCGNVPVDECLAPLSTYAKRVEEVKAELMSTKGIRVEHVIMTSDEKNSGWWDTVHELGWVRLNHSRTVEEYGEWYPVFVDGVVQSGGVGFVATHRSTVSILADRRVLSWQDGVVKTVYWGRAAADDH